jgi:hypothetical protein
VAISESWLSSTDLSASYHISNYCLPIRCDRANNRGGGGTAVWLHNDLGEHSLVIPSSTIPEQLDCVLISIKKLSVLFVSLYISGSTLPSAMYVNILNFIVNTVDEFLIRAPDYKVFICGDFNSVFIKAHLATLCSSLFLTNIVKIPTRNKAILDLCLVPSLYKDLFLEPSIGPPVSSSDHNVVSVVPNNAVDRSYGKECVVYDFRESNIDRFCKALSMIDFGHLYNVDDIDDKATIFNECMKLAFDVIPSRKVIMTKNDKDWLTPKVKLLINDRWNAFRTRNWPVYHILKTKVKLEILNAKCRWAANASHSPKDLWNIVNSVSGKKASASIDSLAGDCVNDFVNLLNNNFALNFNNSDIEPFVIPSHSGYNNWSPNITEEWVFQEITKCKSSKATGSDEIPIRLYQKAAYIVSLPIAHIINSSFLCKKVPRLWKYAHIVAVPKSSPVSIDKLRPISILNFLSKIMEKAALLFIKDSLLQLVDNEQFAYRPASSTTCAIIKLQDLVLKHLDSPQCNAVSLTFLDLEKAFDSIPHNLLIKKLYNLSCNNDNCLPSGFLLWLQSYLCNRTQSVIYKKVVSDSCDIVSGVPQGSLLGPILFSIFMSDLNSVKLNMPASIIKYADDTVLVCNIGKEFDITTKCLDIIVNWCNLNLLALNRGKSHELNICKQNFSQNLIPCNVLRVDKFKYIGIILNNNFNWNSHIEYVCSIAASRMYCIRILTPLLSKSHLISIYCSLIRSVLEYASPAFCKLNLSLVVDLDRIQKRVHRTICCDNANCKKLPKLSTRRSSHCKKLFYKIVNDTTHILHDILPRHLPSGRFEIPFCNTVRRQNSFVMHNLIDH